jgi:hypothetical protein
MRRHMRTCDEPFTTASVREKIKIFKKILSNIDQAKRPCLNKFYDFKMKSIEIDYYTAFSVRLLYGGDLKRDRKLYGECEHKNRVHSESENGE